MPRSIRILLVGDTHIGFDSPLRPRIQRRRRGGDFLMNFDLALKPARKGEVDLVVHGGDLLYRRRVPAPVVQKALEPLRHVADRGVPVVLVPGNHERSELPFPLLASHPLIHVLAEPVTIPLSVGPKVLAVSGFPFQREIGRTFARCLEKTDWQGVEGDARILCLHQAVEGAKVGPGNYTFRPGQDVLRGQELPGKFAAVLSGHIHRAQILRQDLSGRPLPAPVVYPGSVERTSFAEAGEEKGSVLLTVETGPDGGKMSQAVFRPLRTRPMITLNLEVSGLDAEALKRLVEKNLAVLAPDAVVRLRPVGRLSPQARSVWSAPALRALAPGTMNLTVAWKT